MMMRSKYKDIHDWTVMEERVIHAYNEDETPIPVVKLDIGVLTVGEIDDQRNFYHTREFPIIRWISKSEYDYLKKYEGTPIW